MKKANKLLKFTLDDGSGTPRTIVSGIAKFYEPEELVGRDVVFIANLAPRQLMGIENYDGGLSLLSLMKEVKAGSQVG